MTEKNFEYDVGLSFAGEQRSYVEQVARELRARGIRVFYDDYEQDKLWGKDLYAHLTEVYQYGCRYCVIFVSQEYSAKVWPTTELKGAQARAIKEKGEYILPARFDKTPLPGLLDTVRYIDLETTSPAELVELIVKKLGRAPRSEYLPPDLDRLYSRLDVVDDERARSFVDSRASSFFRSLQRMTPDERDVVTGLIQFSCALRGPNDVHIDADYLSRITGKPVPRLRGLLGGIGSLGFSCSFLEGSHDGEDMPGELLGQRFSFHLKWIDLSAHEEFTIEEIEKFDEHLPELIVATEMIECATEDYCEHCGRQFLERLDFSQLAEATATTEARQASG